MFRLLSSGLPQDPVYPTTLEGLGYFINSEDEVRRIENPRAYFKYFLTKNERHNSVQREAMNTALSKIIFDRVHKLGVETEHLPLGTPTTEPHVPILISKDLGMKKRIIVLFYEHNQDLGVFAQRIIGGKGGINQGSVVNFIKHIQSLPTSPENKDSPGIIIANMGQLRWYRKGAKAVTQPTWYSLPIKSAVHGSLRFDPVKNTVPENRSTREHIECVFDQFIAKVAHPDAKLDIIGVSEGAMKAQEFLNKERNWRTWRKRINALVLLAPFYCRDDITNPEFATWLRKRGRVYTVSSEPVNTPLSGADGSRLHPSYGCPNYSIGEPYYTELMLPNGQKHVLDWLQEVANDDQYENNEVVIFEEEEEDLEQGWGVVPESQKWKDVGQDGKDNVKEKEDGADKIADMEPKFSDIPVAVSQALDNALKSASN